MAFGISAGFTLIEVLVATSMVAVLAVSLYASLSIALKARRTATQSVEAVRKLNGAIELIKADLQSAVVPNPATSATSNTGAAASTGAAGATATVTGGPRSGSAAPVTAGVLAGPLTGISGTGFGMAGNGGAAGDDLTFYAAATDVQASPGTAVGDIKRIEYTLAPAADTGEPSLVRLLTTNLLAPTTPVPQQEIICRGVTGFTLRYFDGTTWQSAWDSTTQPAATPLPQAVEVTIILDRGPAAAQAAQTGAGGAADPNLRATRVIVIPCALTAGAAGAAAQSAGGTP